MTGWAVLDEESLSLHRYIQFNIGKSNSQNRNEIKNHWAYRKMDDSKLAEQLSHGAPPQSNEAETACNEAISWLTEICDACMPRAGGGNKRRQVHWWNSEIADQRRACLKARRAYTRKRKKAGEADSIAEGQLFKEQKKLLSVKILESIERHWRDLCSQINRDSWGLPYKLVMK